jgi:hypothetical protein
MGQVNQALTGYGAVSVWATNLRASWLRRHDCRPSLWAIICYLGMMAMAWMLINRYGRRWLMVRGAFWLAGEQYLINHGGFRGRACFPRIVRLCKLCPNC